MARSIQIWRDGVHRPSSSPAPPPPYSPARKPAVAVVDLTLSDSDDDFHSISATSTPVAAPRRLHAVPALVGNSDEEDELESEGSPEPLTRFRRPDIHPAQPASADEDVVGPSEGQRSALQQPARGFGRPIANVVGALAREAALTAPSKPEVGYAPSLVVHQEAQPDFKASEMVEATDAPVADLDGDAVAQAMAETGVNQWLSPEEQEKALTELVAETVDMSEVDLTNPPPEGLSCELLPHQKQGLAWLRDREKGRKRGDILADDMGLGKTVQMISLMLANPPTTKPKTTLIVAPVAVLDQWREEILDKSDAGLRVYIHHGPSRTKEWDMLRRYDVVITSYQTCGSEFNAPPKPKKTRDEDASEQPAQPRKKGPLFEGEYYRVILDEAHEIKNRSTKMHKACVALEAKYRWALSGTPVQNSVDDLFALFEFLGKVVKPLDDYSEFKEKIGDPIKNGRAKVGMARLNVVLRAVMLRRTKTTSIDGKPLLQLPKREIIEVKGPFLDPEEHALYKAVESKMTLEVNKLRDAKAIMSNYTSVLNFLLRMRQACSHRDLITAKITAADLDLVPDSNDQGDNQASTADTSDEVDADGLDGLVDGLTSLAVAEPATCPLCAAALGPEGAGASGYCDACEAKYAAFADMRFSTKILRCLQLLEDIRAETSGTGDRAHKTIIFSQFTSFFDILQPFLRKAGVRFVRLDGSMNTKQRAEALERIKRDDDKYTVILVSIKAGSVGLNLTCCSRVILMDLWWNPAIEAQAFDRAHRFGQKRDVKIYKITIDGTIEDRILELQKEKAELATAALDGGSLTKGNKLSIQDILALFKRDGGRDDA